MPDYHKDWLRSWASSPFFPEFEYKNLSQSLTHLNTCEKCRKKISRWKRIIEKNRQRGDILNVQILEDMIGVSIEKNRNGATIALELKEVGDSRYLPEKIKLKENRLLEKVSVLVLAVILFITSGSQKKVLEKGNELVKGNYLFSEKISLAFAGIGKEKIIPLNLKKNKVVPSKKTHRENPGAQYSRRDIEFQGKCRELSRYCDDENLHALLTNHKLASLDKVLRRKIFFRFLYLKEMNFLFPKDLETHLDLAIFAAILGIKKESARYLSQAVKDHYINYSPRSPDDKNIYNSKEKLTPENLNKKKIAKIASKIFWQRVDERTSKLENSLKFNPYNLEVLQELTVLYAGLGFPVMAEHYRSKYKIQEI